MMKEGSLDKLKDGIELDDVHLFIKGSDEGRMKGHRYHHLFLRKNDIEKELSVLGVYEGKAPHYRAWMELFSIEKEVSFGDEIVEYHGSDIERILLEELSQDIEEGEKFFVEYAGDEETEYILHRGFPVVLSRLGHLLFKNGFTWFKDWYFPEGFNEGGQKLQGEKSIDEEHRVKHLKNIRAEVEEFLRNTDMSSEKYREKAASRAEDIIDRNLSV